MTRVRDSIINSEIIINANFILYKKLVVEGRFFPTFWFLWKIKTRTLWQKCGISPIILYCHLKKILYIYFMKFILYFNISFFRRKGKLKGVLISLAQSRTCASLVLLEVERYVIHNIHSLSKWRWDFCFGIFIVTLCNVIICFCPIIFLIFQP